MEVKPEKQKELGYNNAEYKMYCLGFYHGELRMIEYIEKRLLEIIS